MSQLILGLLVSLMIVMFWAATGHGLWLVVAFVIRQFGSKTCPECSQHLTESDKACRKCGWTSRPINRTAATRVCTQALAAAFERGLIDKETLARGTETISELERSLSGTILSKPNLAAEVVSQRNASVPLDVPKAQSVVPVNPIVSAKVMHPQVPLPSIKHDTPPVLATVIPQSQLHALDQDYPKPIAPSIPHVSRIEQTWGKWLSAFMEEKHIQWGELAGGLLILCCSTALVTSFWEHIASRPWLKFGIFTGINAATLGLGLNAWHRWKLPTTSRGILMIGLLLLPLNFLAFAIFTLGVSWNGWTVVGESLSLIVLGCLAWFAAKVITPRVEVVTTVTMVGFAIANLVVRRVVDAEASTGALYASAGILVGFYLSMMLIGKNLFNIRVSKQSDSERHESLAMMRLLGLGSFGFLIAFGLLLGCSRSPLGSMHQLSPLFSIVALPLLVYSIAIGEQSSAKSRMLLVSFILAAFSLAIACYGVVLAWPMPLLIIACFSGLCWLILVIAKSFPYPQIAYSGYLIGGGVAALLWHVASGHVGLRNDEWRVLLQALVRADTGFAIVVWSAVCLVVSILLSQFENVRHSKVALRAAGLNGIVGTAILTVFGFGHHEYAVSVALIYLLYAVSMIVVATIRRRRYLDGIAGAFVLAGCFQGIAFGLLDGTGWPGAIYWSLTVAAIFVVSAVGIRKSIGAEPFAAPKPLDYWVRGMGALAVVVAIAWLIVGETGTAEPKFLLLGGKELVLLAAVWIAIAWLQKMPTDWTLAEMIATAAGMIWIHHYAKQESWYVAGRAGFLHPYSIQLHLAWFAIFTIVSSLVVALANRWIRPDESGAEEPDESGQLVRQCVLLHKYSIAPWLIQVAVVCFIALAYYSATPGSIQELLPLDGIAEKQSVSFEVESKTVTRSIPDISRFEIAAIPHREAGWDVVSVGEHFAGLPRVFWLWCLLCGSLSVNLWSKPDIGPACALISCALSIALPIASSWESDVAVASALRWSLSFVYAVGCVCLCRLYLYGSAPERANRQGFEKRFDAYFTALFANIVIPLVLMAAIVVSGAVAHFSYDSWQVLFWIVSGLIALAGFVVLLLASRARNQSIGSNYGIASAVLLIAPFLAWFGLQIVLTLVQHPLTGPNGNSLFVRMGLATSYTLPILIFSVGLVSISVVRRNPGIAFAACLVLLLTGLSGFMLALKSEGLKPAAWVGLFAILTIVSGTFTLVWNWYARTNSFGWFRLTGIEPLLESDRAFWQRCLRQIASGFLGTSVCLTALLLLVSGPFLNRLEVFSWVAVFAAIVALSAHFYATKQAALHWWLVAVAFLVAGFAAAVSSNPTSMIVAPCGVLLSTGALMAWRIASRAATAGERVSLALPLMQSFLLALRILSTGKSEHIAVALILAVTSVSLFIAWRTGRFGFGVGAIFTAHVAGLIHTLSSWGGANFFDHVTNTFLMQVSVAAMMSLMCSLVGFAVQMRFLHGVAVFLLAFMSCVWYLLSLNQRMDPFSISYFSLAVGVCMLGSAARYWLRTTRQPDLFVYVSGLCSVVLFFQWVHPEPRVLQWISTLVFAAFCLASSYVWRASDRIRNAVNQLRVLPMLAARPGATVVIFANTLLAFGVTGLGVAAQFLCESQPLRLASAQAIMAVAFAVGLLARYKEMATRETLPTQMDGGSSAMRVIALMLGVCAAVAFGWHFDSIDNISGLNRVSYASLTMAVMGVAYGFGLIKWVGLSQRWRSAALPLMPYLVGATAVSVGWILFSEWSLGFEGLITRMSASAIVCVIVAMAASIAACLAAALIPGHDPFGLSERGRSTYVYISEALLVMLLMHMRLTMPWLFGGWLQSVWPLLMVGLAFVGLGVSEWAKRNKRGVLSEPLERTGMLLPMLPLLAHWMVPSQVHYGVSLLCASVAYASFGYLRKSMLYWGASVVSGNAALWFALQSTDFKLTEHPQLWVIPPALSLLAILQILRDKLPREQVAAGRYIATAGIYVASTAEVFIQGIAEAPWLPIVLAALSIGGVFTGIALRIRAMLWLGSMFLCVAMFTVIWHAAVDLEQTWVWYLSGIVMGILILTMFALFEKRREQLKGWVSNLQTWED